MASPRIKIGTRGSRLALIQTEMVRAALAAPSEAVTFVTGGDKTRDKPLEAINAVTGGRGIFSDELDLAILSGDIDCAVHSVKDLPTDLAPGLVLAAMLKREDPREALVSFKHDRFADIPAGAVFGSASIRREALVRALRPDVSFTLLRGNVDERVKSVQERGLDGTILAVAGLKRLGLTHVIKEILPSTMLMPDPGQGAIGIVCAADNRPLRHLLTALNHPPTQIAVTAERAMLAAAGGARPLGALGVVEGGHLVLQGVVASRDGSRIARDSIAGPAALAASLGRALGLRLAVRQPHEAAA